MTDCSALVFSPNVVFNSPAFLSPAVYTHTFPVLDKGEQVRRLGILGYNFSFLVFGAVVGRKVNSCVRVESLRFTKKEKTD